MPPSKDSQAKATVALEPCDDKGAVIDDISISVSAEQNDSKASVPSATIAAEAIENPKVSPRRQFSGGSRSLTIT